MRLLLILPHLLLIAVLAAPPALGAGGTFDMVATHWQQSWQIDSQSGATAPLGSTTPMSQSPAEIAVDSNGDVYTAFESGLWRLDPYAVMAIDKVGSLPEIGPNAMAFDAMDRLFMVHGSVFIQDELWRWDAANGAVLIGKVTGILGAIHGLTFGLNGVLYGWSIGNTPTSGLVAIDTQTAVATPVNSTTGFDIQFLATRPDGTLIGGRNALYVLSTTPGVPPMQIGPAFNYDLRSADFFTFQSGWSNYGVGHQGTFGVPAFTAGADPVLGTTITLHLENSAQAPSPAVLVRGDHAAQLSTFWGGSLLAELDFALPFTLPAAGLALPVAVPNLPQLNDTSVFLQVIQLDPGAVPAMISNTRGLRLRLGP